MEWENEVRYFAPLRAQFNALTKVFAYLPATMRQLGMTMAEATRSMQKYLEILNTHRYGERRWDGTRWVPR